MTPPSRPRLAVLDDYEGALARSAHVDRLRERVDVTVFDEPLPADQAAQTLQPYQMLIAIRERTPFPASLLAALPNLELISQSGTHAYHADLEEASRRGILIPAGGGESGGPRHSIMPELVFGLLLCLERDIHRLQTEMSDGSWPASLGRSIRDKTMGILGLGRHGLPVARVAQTFGMRTVAWGPTLTPERARDAGVERLELDDLLARVDVLSVHLRLSDLSRGLIDRRRLELMAPDAILINTARGAIVDEEALADVLARGHLAGAGLDVFAHEPLAADSPLRGLPNALLTPHVGWTVDRILDEFAQDTADHVTRYLDGALSEEKLLNPDALATQRDRIGGVARE